MTTPTAAPLLPLSVAIVCRNNASTLSRTLESIRGLASEIVAVDSGSTDATIEILHRFGARVVPSEWLGYIRTKQKALEACANEWVLCLDSDESLEPALFVAIRDTFHAPAASLANGFLINRKTFYRGTPLNHAWQPEWRLRLVRRAKARWAGHDPHDYLELIGGGSPQRLSGDLRHDSFETFADHLRKQWSHASTMAASLHAAGERGSYLSLMLSPPGAFLKQLLLKRGFLDGYPGVLAAASTAAASLMKHSILLELGRNPPATRADRC